MAQMIVRNDVARKSHLFCKLSLLIIDQEKKKKNKSVIMTQSTLRMHNIRSQHKKIILSIIYMQSFVRRIVAQNEYELAKSRFLLCFLATTSSYFKEYGEL